MRKLYMLVFVLFVAFQSCKKANSNYEYDETENFVSESESSEAYPDGTYAADVEYYNPDTGTRNTYTLNVEVESNQVTLIHWPNGGWLDSSHFSPEELDSSGYCSFTSDQGYEYSIQITGDETSYTDEGRARSDSEDDQAAVTCPECGDDKDEGDEYCYSCKHKFTCPECGGKKSKYDDLCEDCKRKRESEDEDY